MQNKRDHLQAHRYAGARLVSALVRAEPDAPERPMRRTGVGTVVGTLLGLLGLACFAVYGTVRGGTGDAWRADGAIIREKETNTLYVLVGDTLRPVVNYPSARLAVGAHAHEVTVARAALAGVPRGRAIGITDGPYALPDPGRMARGPWLVCDADGQDGRPQVVLAVGVDWPAQPVPDDQAVLVQSASDERYLALRDRRLRVTDAAVVVLGFGSVQAVPVGPAWLNALPAGGDLAAPPVAGRGTPGRRVDGHPTQVGDLFTLDVAGGASYFAMTGKGLAAITETEYLLRQAAGGARTGPLSVAAASTAHRPETTPMSYPPVRPRPAARLDPGRSLCTQVTGAARQDAAARLVTVDRELLRSARPAGGADGAADLLAVPAGGGALVSSEAAPGVSGGTTYLVTELGIKYPLGSSDIAAVLGLGGTDPVPMPGPVLSLLPTGPVLDPQAARTEVAGAETAGTTRPRTSAVAR
ncbi:type VII secretion protein EccB [Krasilnikovia sp. M28-CT-15]|uniref:type VII secretion protein EccB n=1 Tax=Krasilnikovia sp. M28-CT-15 TaxID=3373540 RepID=UPI003875F90C